MCMCVFVCVYRVFLVLIRLVSVTKIEHHWVRHVHHVAV